MSMTPGATFELDGHPDAELNGSYYCLRATHHADNADVELGGGGGSNYDNDFICAPLQTAYTPAQRRRPRIFGLQTATVVGPPAEEIHTDAYGRVKVRMHWDREQRGQEDDDWAPAGGRGLQQGGGGARPPPRRPGHSPAPAPGLAGGPEATAPDRQGQGGRRGGGPRRPDRPPSRRRRSARRAGGGGGGGRRGERVPIGANAG